MAVAVAVTAIVLSDRTARPVEAGGPHDTVVSFERLIPLDDAVRLVSEATSTQLEVSGSMTFFHAYAGRDRYWTGGYTFQVAELEGDAAKLEATYERDYEAMLQENLSIAKEQSASPSNEDSAAWSDVADEMEQRIHYYEEHGIEVYALASVMTQEQTREIERRDVVAVVDDSDLAAPVAPWGDEK